MLPAIVTKSGHKSVTNISALVKYLIWMYSEIDRAKPSHGAQDNPKTCDNYLHLLAVYVLSAASVARIYFPPGTSSSIPHKLSMLSSEWHRPIEGMARRANGSLLPSTY